MQEPERERIVVSVGGSLIVPDGIDTDFLSRLQTFVNKKIGEGYGFYIIAGGGRTCRTYQAAAKEAYAEVGAEALDWIGIASIRLNAELIRSLFPTTPAVLHDLTAAVDQNAPLIIASAAKPGNSSDWGAVEAARATGAKRLVNLSNIDYVYDADPRRNPGAKQIEKITWSDFRKLIPETWDPGLSSPFDPIAAKEAEALGLEVAIINGARLEELENYLDGKAFVGTVIS